MPKALHPYDVLRRPVVTEKSTMLAGQNKYVFEVAMAANKPQIREAGQRAFEVKVSAVTTAGVRGRLRRYGRQGGGQRPSWKKAIVTLAPGDTIEIFEGV